MAAEFETGGQPHSGGHSFTGTIQLSEMKNCLHLILSTAFFGFWLQVGQSQCTPDVKSPTVVCLNGLSVSLFSSVSVVVYDTDFLQYVQDNCTPASDIETSIVRTSDNYTSFPLNSSGQPIHGVEVNCVDIGTVYMNLWARDATGNADFCQSYLIVNDNIGACVPQITVGGFAKTDTGNGIENATVHLTGPGVNQSVFTSQTGAFSFPNVPTGQTYEVCVSKDDNPVNGVSSFDQVFLRKQIQQIEPLATPYRIIGCDVTASNAPPSVGDLIHIQKPVPVKRTGKKAA